jgi:hypothetical protein
VLSLAVCGHAEALSCMPYRRGRNVFPLSKKRCRVCLCVFIGMGVRTLRVSPVYCVIRKKNEISRE